MPTADEVIVEFEARVGKYEADLKRSAATFERVTKAQQQQMLALERQISASTGIIGGAFKGLAALFSAQQVTKLSDDYTRLQNSLKVAGLEGENLLKVQGQLLDLGGEYGVSVNTLADLYGNLSQVSGELGASQDQVMRINEAVAQSLIVTGKSSQEAAGAVLGLVQAFGNGKLQAEEWAQINEGGLRPLLEAAAASEKYGGSVQKLRKAVYDGKVTSQEFFRAILDGAGVIEGKAANATLTLEGAYTALNNRLIEFVGSAASSSGAAGALASGLQSLADNLDTVSKALAVIVAIVGVRYVSAMVAARVAKVNLIATEVLETQSKAALTTATYQANKALLGEAAAARLAAQEVTRLSVAQGVAARAGSGLLAALGGPIGASVLALGAGIAYLASKSAEADAATAELTAKVQAQSAQFADLRQKQAQAAAESNNLTSKQRAALTATANLTGEANLLANAWGRVAAEAKRAAVEQANATLMEARRNVNAARTTYQNRVQSALDNPANRPFAERGLSQGVLNDPGKALADARASASAEKKLYDEAAENFRTARQEYDKELARSLTDPKYKPAPPAAAVDDPNSANAKALAKHQQTLADLEKLKASASGKELAAINKKIAREQAIIGNLEKGVGETAAIAAATATSASHERDANRAQEDIARLASEELQAKLDLATSADERAEIQRQLLEAERSQRIAEIQANKDMTTAQKAAALKSIDRLYGPASKPGELVVSPSLYGSKAQRDADQQRAREAQDLADEQNRAQQEILRNQYDLADSSAERKRLALASIDLEDRYQRAQLQAIIDLEGANSAAGKRAQVALDAQTEITNGRKASALRSNQSPLEAYRDKLDRDAGETSDLVEGYVVDELQSVRDSIRSSIEKQIGIKDPLISGLLKMLIEDVLIKPMLDSLKNADGSGGGFIGSLVKFGTSLFGGGRAIGGNVKAGTPYMVGESGREMFVPQQSGVVVPNHRLKGNSAATSVYQTFTIDNRGGITTPELLDYVNSTARSEATRAGGAAYAQSQQSAPGTINKYNQLRG